MCLFTKIKKRKREKRKETLRLFGEQAAVKNLNKINAKFFGKSFAL